MLQLAKEGREEGGPAQHQSNISHSTLRRLVRSTANEATKPRNQGKALCTSPLMFLCFLQHLIKTDESKTRDRSKIGGSKTRETRNPTTSLLPLTPTVVRQHDLGRSFLCLWHIVCRLETGEREGEREVESAMMSLARFVLSLSHPLGSPVVAAAWRPGQEKEGVLEK